MKLNLVNNKYVWRFQTHLGRCCYRQLEFLYVFNGFGVPVVGCPCSNDLLSALVGLSAAVVLLIRTA